jgi:hypothetical protein
MRGCHDFYAAFIVAILCVGQGNTAPAPRTIVIVAAPNDGQMLTVTTLLGAADCRGVVLIESERSKPFIATFIDQFDPAEIVLIGRGLAREDDRSFRGKKVTTISWNNSQPVELWKRLTPRLKRVVLSPTSPRSLLLRAAHFAELLKAPLVPVGENGPQSAELTDILARWQVSEVHAIGGCDSRLHIPESATVARYADESSLETEVLRRLAANDRIDALVVANPFDQKSLSLLAPMVAGNHRAALLLTNHAGTNVEKLVRKVIRQRVFRRADNLILVGDLNALPTLKRDNPIAGKDEKIEMEPLTPEGSELYRYATGRLFDADLGLLSLQLARSHLLESGPKTAMVVSNAGGSLPLLETFSRLTAHELANRGYLTTACFGEQVDRDEMRCKLPQCDLFLWEGHHSTLMKEYGFAEWNEPLKPSLIVLQSCLALAEEKAQPLFHRGAIAVVGTSTRSYSASGGAFSLAFLDAMLYDGQTLGGALRQAKNFLVLYQDLKEKRLSSKPRLNGASTRAAWAFTLWGDPTVRLPQPPKNEAELSAIRLKMRSSRSTQGGQTHTLSLELPDTTYEPIRSGKYTAAVRPNIRLAGLIQSGVADGESQKLVPFLFHEISFDSAPEDKSPQLRSSMPEANWHFRWDANRRVGYLIMSPRAKDRGPIRFHVDWVSRNESE